MNGRESRWEESNPDLVRIIRDEIADRGPLRFDRFMELALYHHEHGYYQVPEPGPGRRGDFLTAPETHPIFGATLAGQIVEFDNLLDQPDPFVLIEFGAGSGRLIRPLLAELRQQHNSIYQRLTYLPVEANPARLRELEEHLKDGGHAKRLTVSPLSNVSGCILCNEFLDAFPVRRITWSHYWPAEAYADWDGHWFVETVRPVEDEEVLRYLNRHGFELSDGEWVEYAPGLADWTIEAADVLERGFVLLIDYGYPAGELFSDHRRRGTMKSYFQHGASDEYYRGVGKQDLTAHVNFSEVEHHLTRSGFQPLGMTTQADFLSALGIGERLVHLQSISELQAEQYLGVRAAVMRMIDPGAMGRFRVAFTCKGISSPVALHALSRVPPVPTFDN